MAETVWRSEFDYACRQSAERQIEYIEQQALSWTRSLYIRVREGLESDAIAYFQKSGFIVSNKANGDTCIERVEIQVKPGAITILSEREWEMCRSFVWLHVCGDRIMEPRILVELPKSPAYRIVSWN
jgi:hypothetical protein